MPIGIALHKITGKSTPLAVHARGGRRDIQPLFLVSSAGCEIDDLKSARYLAISRGEHNEYPSGKASGCCLQQLIISPHRAGKRNGTLPLSLSHPLPRAARPAPCSRADHVIPVAIFYLGGSCMHRKRKLSPVEQII